MMVTIKQWHLVVAFIMGIMAPLAAGMSSYYKTVGEIRENYVKKDELKDVVDKLERIGEDLAEIKGEMKATRHVLETSANTSPKTK